MGSTWNSELEQLVRKVGDYVESQVTELINPHTSAIGSTFRTSFKAATIGRPLLQKTFAVAGLGRPAMWGDSRLKHLVEIAEQNGSDAAVKIKRAMEINKQLNEKILQDGGMRFKPRLGDVLRRIKFAKRQNLKF